ncbi:MAG: FHA domain-containing protein [Deltaproteobacteria bacterium]|nr:FHA domain-containing protein [Deltaproteobacteria bacterium]
MIVLVPIDEDGEDRTPLEFDQPRIRVGRGPHNELVLDEEDQAASYEHALINVQENSAVVVCEPTANPTYIDGADISLAPEEERQLKPGDIVSFGKGRSMFRVSRIGELAEPRRVLQKKGRGRSGTTRGNQGSERRADGPPPPPRARDEDHDRDVFPITFQVFKADRMVREETFEQPLVRIGRMKSSHLLLDDESVSRTHAVVEVTAEGEVLLIDLDSSSGTAIDGKRVKKAVLASGDQVEFGKARVVIKYDKTAANAATRPRAAVRGRGERRRPISTPPPPHEAGFGSSGTEVLSLDQLEVIDSPRLVVRRGGAEQDEIPLVKPCTSIGRLPENDVQLDDGAVSGKHAMVVAEAGVYLIIDQHSTNGTYLNGERCVGESLRHGDVIQIGRYELVFVASGPEFAQHPPGTEVLSPEAARAIFAKVGGRRRNQK